MSSSAFVQKADESVREDIASGPKPWSEWALENFEVLIDGACDAIPSDDVQALPKNYRYSIGIFFYTVLGVIFAVLFNQAYHKSRTTKYLSPITSNIYCHNISATNTGTYLATMNGLWQGNPSFEYSSAAYQLQVTSHAFPVSNYTSGMETVYQKIFNLTKIMNTSDLSLNLLIWMSYNIQISGITNYFTFTGNPTYIFNRQHATGSLSSVHGICQNASVTSGYDFTSSTLSSAYFYHKFIVNPICMEAAIPQYFGFLPKLSSDSFQLRLDVRSIVTALAVNTGGLSMNNMNQISSTKTNFSYKGVNYIAAQYYNQKFYGMDPIFCINATDVSINNELCIILISGTIYAIPFFNHAGQSPNLPVPCDCSTLTPEELMDEFNTCNIFNFLSGVIYWNTPNYTTVIEQYLKVNGDLFTLNKQTYVASYISSYFGQTSVNTAELRSNQSLYDAFEFCNIPGFGYCSMATFTSFDETDPSWDVSEYYYQLNNGACRNSLLTTQSDW